ncbi:MAG: TVP38/TMEM64 family protein [Bacillus sp. (in: firmicutes)]
MEEQVISILATYEELAVVISILLNIIISILGFVPSVFLTAANIAIFGLLQGTIISLIGEAMGAVISFILYRKGFSRLSKSKFFSHPKISRLLHASSREAFLLILSLRIMPFMPSGVVTFIAAIGTTPFFVFVAASTVGKIPALLLEVYSVNQLIQWTRQGKVIFAAISILLLGWLWKRIRNIELSGKSS